MDFTPAKFFYKNTKIYQIRKTINIQKKITDTDTETKLIEKKVLIFFFGTILAFRLEIFLLLVDKKYYLKIEKL